VITIETKEAWAWWLLSHVMTVVASIDGCVVGSCEVQDWDTPEPSLWSLEVNPDFRRRGVGTASAGI
jgi:ribosomal protein S18 acetylase RimI-like enzyme